MFWSHESRRFYQGKKILQRLFWSSDKDVDVMTDPETTVVTFRQYVHNNVPDDDEDEAEIRRKDHRKDVIHDSNTENCLHYSMYNLNKR